MKNLLLFLTAFLFINTVNAQTINAFNPLVQNLHFTPEPNVFGFQNCSETFAKFNFGMTTQQNANLFATDPLKINICLQGFLPANINPAQVVYGPQSQYFQWTYDILSNCIQGVQIDTLFGTGNNIFNLDPRAFGEIGVHLQIASYLPVPAVLNVDVNLEIPNYMLVGNALDDHEFTTTQNYIGVTSAEGTLFIDTANSNTPTGVPNGRPSGTPMFVNVIDDITGLVEDNALIDSNGTYYVDSLRPERSYSITLSSVQGINGQTPPPIALPANWSFSSEDCCDNISNDGLANGNLSIWANTCAVINANFAISNPSFVYSSEFNQMDVALAMNRLNFQIIEKNCNTILFWNNTAENNYNRYEIMRKDASATTYSKIGEVNVLPNTPLDFQYTFVSKNNKPENETVHYQLKIVDHNEQNLLSPIKSITLNCKGESSIATLYPNPASENINILFDNKNESEAIQISILDVVGKVLYTTVKDLASGANNFRFDVSQYPTGYYFMKYTDFENNSKGTLRFTVK